MIDSATLRDTIATYAKHGWMLRRVLLSAAESKAAEGVVGAELIRESDVPAAWFSRPPADGPVAWEIRYLGGSPYALVEHFDESDADFENGLRAVEERLREAVASRKSA
jgi:hypothetical protein